MMKSTQLEPIKRKQFRRRETGYVRQVYRIVGHGDHAQYRLPIQGAGGCRGEKAASRFDANRRFALPTSGGGLAGKQDAAIFRDPDRVSPES